MEIVYCAHSHTTKILSTLICFYVIKKGFAPVDPFLIFPSDVLEVFDYEKEERLALDLSILRKCDRLWVFGEPYTPGVMTEVDTYKHEVNKYSVEHISWEELRSLVG